MKFDNSETNERETKKKEIASPCVCVYVCTGTCECVCVRVRVRVLLVHMCICTINTGRAHVYKFMHFCHRNSLSPKRCLCQVHRVSSIWILFT